MIRAACIDDLPQIQTLVREGCAALPDNQAMRAELIEASIAGAVASGEKIFVCQEGDQVVGVCGWVRLPTNPEWVIASGTFVHPAFHRRGIATQLYARALEHWKAAGALHVLASAAATNIPSLKLLESHGFSVSGIEMTKEI